MDDTYKQITAWSLDYWKFAYECLGFKEMNDEHRKLCTFLQQEGRYKIMLLPRYSFKSCVITQGHALWKLINNPNERILIYSDTASKAQGFLTGIKNHIEGKAYRSVFRDVFGSWETDAHKGKWNESQIIIRNREFHTVEPTIDTGGIETTKVGMHYDTIYFDDIVSDVNTTTKEQMDKVHECYQKSLSLLRPGGSIYIIGTRWNFGDLYGRLIEETRETGQFQMMVRSAEDKNEKGELIFADIGLDAAALKVKRTSQSNYIYSCLYLNNPVDDESALYKVCDFKFYDTLKQSGKAWEKGLYPELHITCTVDPAGEGEDFTAITVVGTDNAFKIHILDLINEHLQPDEMIDRVFLLNEKYHFKRVGIETTFFRGMLKRDFERRRQEEQEKDGFPMFAIEEFKTRWRKGEGKDVRIRGLEPFHARGDLLFPGKAFETLTGVFRDLAYQMIQYPKAAHDDLIDALSWQVELLQKGGVAKKAGPPKMSPAWLEETHIKKFEQKNKRYPKRYRKQLVRSLS